MKPLTFLRKTLSNYRFILWSFSGFFQLWTSSCFFWFQVYHLSWKYYFSYLSPCSKKYLLTLLNINTNKIKNFCLLCFQLPVHLPTPSSTSKPNTATFLTPLEMKAKVEAENSLDELKAQIVELLYVVEALKKDHGWVAFVFFEYYLTHL